MESPEPFTVMIVDDEPLARALLVEMIGRIEGVRVVAQCADGFEAVAAAQAGRPQAALLDIEMPKLDGFEVAELLDPEIAVVFVTAYDRYAVKAFEKHAVDYVLKPFREERLREAIGRARQRRQNSVGASGAAAVAAAARPPGVYPTRVAVREGSAVHVLPLDRVDCFEAQDDLVVVKSGGRSYRRAQTLASLADGLDPERFLRVHRSYVVNLDRISRLESYAKNSYAAVLADGTRVPVSRGGYARLRERLSKSV